VRLDIGSGKYRYKDFTTVDLYTKEADIKADMGNLPMIESGSVEEIWASHCLEHILPEKVQPTLKEWIRILRPGGIATIIVPDLDDACRQWLQRTPASLTMIYGELGVGKAHYHGWGALELRDELLDAGFDVISVQALRETVQNNFGGTYLHFMVNLCAIARKR
jgi:SAM-dependent methyltransferase